MGRKFDLDLESTRTIRHARSSGHASFLCSSDVTWYPSIACQASRLERTHNSQFRYRLLRRPKHLRPAQRVNWCLEGKTVSCLRNWNPLYPITKSQLLSVISPRRKADGASLAVAELRPIIEMMNPSARSILGFSFGQDWSTLRYRKASRPSFEMVYSTGSEQW